MPKEFYTRERCFITELLNDAATASFSIARCRVEPAVLTELHSLSVSEWYVIEAGEGRVSTAGTGFRAVGPGDVVAIPPGTAQQIRNTGADQLKFLCVCVPRFTPSCYKPLED